MIEHLNGTHETISYKTGNGIKLYNNANTSSYPLHWHTGIEIIYPTLNTYAVRIHNTYISLEENDILIIPSGELHSLFAPNTYGHRLILQIDYPQLSMHKEMRSLMNLLKPYYVIHKAQHPNLISSLAGYLDQIQHEYDDCGNFYETYVYSLVEQFFVTIGRNYLMVKVMNNNDSSMQKKSSNQENMELFLSVCDYINSNFQNSPSLEAASAITGYSKSHFCRFFKLYAGKSFYDYLLGVKISHTDSLLNMTNQSITEIALSSGFNSVSTFNRVFHQFHNCTPTQYRNFQVSNDIE